MSLVADILQGLTEPLNRHGPPGRVRSTFNLIDWAQQSEVRTAWSELMKAHTLVKDPLQDPTKSNFSSLQFSLTMSWSWQASMDKARKYGWHGHVDSIESMKEVFERFVETKMIPPLPK